MMSQLSDQQIYIVHVTVLYEPDIYKWYYVFLYFIQDGNTMLHVAAYNEQNNVISYLLGIGADPNIQNKVNIYR